MSGGCEAFKWPLDKERAAFADAALEKVASGAARGPLKEQAFALTLIPVAEVAYALPPAARRRRMPRAAVRRDGRVRRAGEAGLYQVTLSGEGWIDLVQDGAPRAADHTGAKECPGLRKSVRFNVGAAPIALQLSGAPADTIKVAIRPVE